MNLGVSVDNGVWETSSPVPNRPKLIVHLVSVTPVFTVCPLVPRYLPQGQLNPKIRDEAQTVTVLVRGDEVVLRPVSGQTTKVVRTHTTSEMFDLVGSVNRCSEKIR